MQQKDIKRIYLSGPITGNENAAHLFSTVENYLKNKGIEVVNPLKINPPDIDWTSAMRTDIKALVDCDAILMLPGWKGSMGAEIEYTIAEKLGMVALFYTEEGTIIRSDKTNKYIITELITSAIYNVLGISLDTLIRKTRKANVVDARRICCLLMPKMGITKVSEIAKILRIHHATVIFHRRRGSELLRYDKQFAKKYEMVNNYLKKIYSYD